MRKNHYSKNFLSFAYTKPASELAIVVSYLRSTACSAHMCLCGRSAYRSKTFLIDRITQYGLTRTYLKNVRIYISQLCTRTAFGVIFLFTAHSGCSIIFISIIIFLLLLLWLLFLLQWLSVCPKVSGFIGRNGRVYIHVTTQPTMIFRFTRHSGLGIIYPKTKD